MHTVNIIWFTVNAAIALVYLAMDKPIVQRRGTLASTVVLEVAMIVLNLIYP